MWATYVAGQVIAAAQGSLVSLVVVGDLMLNGLHPSNTAFQSVYKELSTPDVCFGNLETILTSGGRTTPYKSPADLAARRQYVLRADPRWAPLLAEAGFDVLSLANNHAMDYRADALTSTIRSLGKHAVAVVGAGLNEKEAAAPVVIKAGGRRIAFLAFLAFRGEKALAACGPAGPERPGVNPMRGGGAGVGHVVRRTLRETIARAKKSADLVLVSYHWGLERHTTPTEYQVSLAKATIDAGADGVIGHHPHVLQPYALYRGKPILYSLGNFVSPRFAGPIGDTVLVELRYRGQWLTSLRFTPARIRKGFPEKRIGKEAQAELDRLGKTAISFRMTGRGED